MGKHFFHLVIGLSLCIVAFLFSARVIMNLDLTEPVETLRRMVWPHRTQTLSPMKSSDIMGRLHELFLSFDMDSSDWRSSLFLEDSTIEIIASIPRGKPLEWIVWNFFEITRKIPYHIEDCITQKGEAADCRLRISHNSPRRKKPDVIVTITRSRKFFPNSAKMALLIEQFEFHADKPTALLLSFPHPLTIAIVPLDDRASWTAQMVDDHNKEIVIQLPLEPTTHIPAKYRGATIMVHHSESSITGACTEGARRIPNFAGYCSLMGSRALADTRVVRLILSVVKKRKGYFIETETFRKSTVQAQAEALGVPYLRVRRTIDHGQTVEEITADIRHCIVVARKRGTLLATTRLSPALIQALSSALPLFKDNGVTLVHVSEIVPHP